MADRNEAAWLMSAAEHPLSVKSAPSFSPGPGEIVIKNAAVAIKYGIYISNYPAMLGVDAAGVVEEVGTGVTRFKKGDRIIAHCPSLMTSNPAHAAFQTYPVAAESMVSPIPSTLSIEQAVVLPLAIFTASAGLYQESVLNLPLPSATGRKKTSRTTLVWGGASSVGAAAIQLAAASGLTVVTTASPANHAFVRSLGADTVFDYRSSSVVEDLAAVLSETDFVGVYDSIGEGASLDAVYSLLDRLGKKVPVTTVLPTDKRTERFASQNTSCFTFVAFDIIREPNQHIGEWIFKKFIPEALARGKLQAKPEPLVVGHGLEDIQEALDVQRNGVSAKKIVVTL